MGQASKVIIGLNIVTIICVVTAFIWIQNIQQEESSKLFDEIESLKEDVKKLDIIRGEYDDTFENITETNRRVMKELERVDHQIRDFGRDIRSILGVRQFHEKGFSIEPYNSKYYWQSIVWFSIKSSIQYNDSMIKIWDSDDNLVWVTDEFLWDLNGYYYFIPYVDQTSNGEMMVIPSNAKGGIWSYAWIYNQTIIISGEFEVIEAPRPISS